MKKIFIAIGSIFLMYGCSPSGIRGEILNYCKDKEGCIVKLKDVTKFKWTKMFVFRNAPIEIIEKAIGTDYPYYVEFATTFIFLDEGRIVYHEDNKANIEKVDKGDLVFKFSGATYYRSYTPDEATFKLIKVDDGDGVYYTLQKQ
jgi:hypothetical protein